MNSAAAPAAMSSTRTARTTRPFQEFTPPTDRAAEEIVAEKVSRFAHQRQAIVEAIAKRFNVAAPLEVNRFFAAARAGRWEETTNLFAALKQLQMSENRPPDLEKLWPAILETYGVAEQAHNWPAQKLLDYGNAVLDSLRPGMVYIGGTDAGRFIPALLNDTGEGDPHIVLTQNALADASYLEYLRFQYGDRISALTGEDSQNSFQAYLADAQKRLLHDQQFPDEAKQVRPGEDIQVTDGRVQVSGQVAVMAINEQLLKTLLQKNPDLAFALEESFAFKSLYAGATTLGPITELRLTDPASALTAERAAQSLDYWRSTTQALLAEPDLATAPRDAYASLILGQANLFLDRNYPGEAEQAFQLANQLNPANPAGVFGYVGLLTQQQRYDEARRVVQTAVNLTPDYSQFNDLLNRLSQMK
jgi:tetratricopeptide (TPR) repeat protein